MEMANNELFGNSEQLDYISRQVAIDEVDSETVSTNPEHFKSSEKFIKFMDDDDIASFGKWQWANGFNTALVATKVQLKKLPPAQSEYKPVTAEDFAKIMSENTKYDFVTWHIEALTLMNERGFVICKREM